MERSGRCFQPSGCLYCDEESRSVANRYGQRQGVVRGLDDIVTGIICDVLFFARV